MPVASRRPRSTFHADDSWLIGNVLALLTFWLFAQSLLNVIPEIRTSLGLTRATADLSVTITALFAGVFIVVAGGLGDRFGYATVFRVGVLLSIVGSGLLVLTPTNAGGLTTAIILTGRIAQGLSTACIMPASLAMINRFYQAEKRQRAVSFFSIGTFGGLGLASLIGGAIASSIGWRSIFVVSIAVAVLALFLTRATPVIRGKEQQTEGRGGFDFAGLAAFLVAMVGLNVYISQGRQLGWASLVGIFLIAVTCVAFAAFIAIGRRRGQDAFVDLAMFKIPQFTGPVVANFLMNATAAVIITALGLMQRAAGWSSLQAGLLTIGHLIAVLVSIRLGEKLLQRLGPRRPMLWGALSNLVGVALVACTFLPQPVYVVAVVIGLALFGFGQGVFATPAIDATITSVPAAEVGVASGILKMGSTLGQAIGVALSTTIAAVGASAASSEWTIFRGWGPESVPARFGAMLGAGLLIIIALIMIATIITTVPRDEKDVSSP